MQTSDIKGAANAVEPHPVVLDARAVDQHDGHDVLEIVLLERVDRVPPAVLRDLGDHDCGITFAQPQGDHLVVEVQ
ncbi:hypothetical protein [Halostagnicola kamekurae]|uniref:hypothetical protein n=1 Tax=Halostagnicola kamekurae TaxID=619731 RepID=UPI001FEA3059|nr:hypothetical protein [Halostagnicola kamekurae]